MADSQYEMFRNLDRHCLAIDATPADCLDVAHKKRTIIENALTQTNPLVREVVEGRTTFTAIYDSYSRSMRGFRRFLPHPHSRESNERLECLAKILPNVGHFKRRSLLAADNPITAAIYGVLASFAIGLIWTLANRDNAPTDAEGMAAEGRVQLVLAVVFGFIGFGLGLFAMLKYRTRDRRRIHAHEAAAYMDLNYECYRSLDDKAWADFMTKKQQSAARAPNSTGSITTPAPT